VKYRRTSSDLRRKRRNQPRTSVLSQPQAGGDPPAENGPRSACYDLAVRSPTPSPTPACEAERRSERSN
jgi:hypothetical protein